MFCIRPIGLTKLTYQHLSICWGKNVIITKQDLLINLVCNCLLHISLVFQVLKSIIYCLADFQFTFVKFVVCIYLILSQTSPGFYISAVKVFWKQCGKRRNCLYWVIILFSRGFIPVLKKILQFLFGLRLSSAGSFCLEESRICRLGGG